MDTPDARVSTARRSLIIGGTLLAGFAWIFWHRAVVRLLPHGEDLSYLNRALPGGSFLIAIIPLVLIVYVGIRLIPNSAQFSRRNQFYLFIALVAFVLVTVYAGGELMHFGRPERMP